MLKKVALIYTDQYQRYNFGPTHPLRPLRLELTYSLMAKLGLLQDKVLEIIEPKIATQEEIEWVHSHDYVEAVKKLSSSPEDLSIKSSAYGLGPGDNPIFKGMYEASALVCGASMTAAETVWDDSNSINIAFNISGGLHHAMHNKASGFCIFNDIAVAIHKLKRLQPNIRIAYLDVDCHHGDGVQWLFYKDPNVLKISLHESGKFLFPGTGDTNEIGEGLGEGYSINFPLLPGTSDRMYLKLFRTCIPRILEAYSPDLLITQLGVDTHINDPLTQFGMSIGVHRDLAQTIKTSAREYCNDKWLALGGGGYSMTVVPRVWSLYLAKMLEVELKNELPDDWRQEAVNKAPFEEKPIMLWDRADKNTQMLLANPDSTKKMIEYLNQLIKICNNEYLPRISN
ncbi:MAG: acetoin utilization protein AcuC [Promethearchaeota archaeon]